METPEFPWLLVLISFGLGILLQLLLFRKTLEQIRDRLDRSDRSIYDLQLKSVNKNAASYEEQIRGTPYEKDVTYKPWK